MDTIQTRLKRESDNGGIISGTWRTDAFNHALTNNISTDTGSNNFSILTKNVRDNFKAYFNSDIGTLPWQLEYIHSTSNHFDKYE